MHSSSLHRGYLLVQQQRWELAEKELRLCLADDPNRAEGHSLLALCLIQRKQFDEATREAKEGVHLAPENAAAHYMLSRVYYERNQFTEAEESAREALRLDPFDADYFGWLARILFTRRRWHEALDAADQGLALDGEHVDCANLRAMALVKLGRKLDAENTIGSALERNPENADSHANLGWTLLEQRQPEKALHHFREALRLEPNMEWARLGIIEAMKSRYLIYRLILGYFLWMMKLSERAQIFIVIGGYLGFRALREIARQNPQLRLFVLPILIAYIGFAVMTWLAVPLFNLVLRLSRFGRLALSREEISTSNWVGGALLLAIVILPFSFFYESLLFVALMCGLMSLPLAHIYDCDAGWPRKTLALITLGMGLLALASSGLMLTGEILELQGNKKRAAGPMDMGFMCSGIFLVGIFLMQFVIPILSRITPRR